MTISRLIEYLNTIIELFSDDTEIEIEIPNGHGSFDTYDVDGIFLKDNAIVIKGDYE